jgi:hypothetical protein
LIISMTIIGRIQGTWGQCRLSVSTVNGLGCSSVDR